MRIAPMVCLCWMLLPAQVWAAVISEIRFEGNKVTKEEVLRQELLVHEGDEVDDVLIETSRQAIMNLGLFKSVTSRLEGDVAEKRLVFTVEERYFLLPIPLLDARAKDGNLLDGLGKYSYGVELRHDNLLGLNHRLKLTYEYTVSTDSTVPKERKAEASYTIPRIIGTAYQLSLNAGQTAIRVEEEKDGVLRGLYRRDVTSGGFYVSRLLEPKGITQGWSVGVGMNASTQTFHDQYGTGFLNSDRQTIGMISGVNYSVIQRYPYHRDGKEFGYNLSFGLPQVGSDTSYTFHDFFYRSYSPLQRLDANVNLQFKLGLGQGPGKHYGLGNSTLLRGYDNDYVRGDAMVLMNAEYHHHLSGYRQLRGVLFADAGNAWDTVDDVGSGTILGSLGVGLRWRVQSFVNLTLRIDYAYALEAKTSKVLMATSASF